MSGVSLRCVATQGCPDAISCCGLSAVFYFIKIALGSSAEPNFSLQEEPPFPLSNSGATLVI